MNKQKSVEQHIELALRQGRWKLSERLPSERSLAAELHVNRTTLRSALCSLSGRGILEIRHGSGSRVKKLPTSSVLQGEITDSLYSCLVIIPAVVHACSILMRPSHILTLERILPRAGTALRTGDIGTFAQAQLQFFIKISSVADNAGINAALTDCLPDSKTLAQLCAACTLQENESVFARLARLLSALRHADAQDAQASARDYFCTLQHLAENK